MNYNILTEEMSNDPLAVGYAGMSNIDILNSLLAKNRTRPRRVGSIELLVWGGQNGRIAKVRKAAQGLAPYDSLSDTLRSATIVADALINRTDAGFDANDARHVALVDGLVAASVFTADDKASLLELATEQISRAEELGIPDVGLGHVISAKEMLNG